MLKPYTEFCFVFQSSVPTAHSFECRMMCMAERRCAFSSCKPASQHTVMFALLLSEILHVAMFSTWWFILTHRLLERTLCLKPRGLLFYSGYCLYCPLSFTTAATSIIFKYQPKCSCGYSRETAEHYLLHCPNYLNIRARTILTLPSNQTNIRTLLYGNLDLRLPENKHIFLTVHEFIKLSKRL